MSAAFDPYYKWLGIPPQDQPADHYRLLGLTHFESDPQVIESAADRQMVHLRTFANGPHSALSQRLLNEVAAARICLLNAPRKATYDQSLRQRLAASPVVMAMPSAGHGFDPVVNDFSEIPIVTLAPRALPTVPSRPLWRHPAVLSGLATAIILGVAILNAMNDGERADVDPSNTPLANVPSSQLAPPPSKPVESPQTHPDGGNSTETSTPAGAGMTSTASKALPPLGAAFADIIAGGSPIGNAANSATASTATVVTPDPGSAASVVPSATDKPVEPGSVTPPTADSSVDEPSQPGPKPIPTAAARQIAEKTFQEAFADDLARATKPADKVLLARELANKARGAVGDPADHYVLLGEARRLAIEGGEVGLVLEVINAFEQHFESDHWPPRLAALASLSRHATSLEAKQALASSCLQMAEQAAAQDQFGHAADLCGLVVTVATAMKDNEQSKDAKELQEGYKTRQKQWEFASRARDVLEQSPDDAPANLAWGKYVCLVRGNWDAGLPLLAKGADAKLREVAQQEIAQANTSAARVEIGDAWFAVAGASKTDKAERQAFLARAKEWFERAGDDLSKPELARVEKRVLDINEQLHKLTGGKGRPAFPLTGLVGRVRVDGKDANLVIHYQPTKTFNAQAVKDLLARHNIKGSAVQIELVGALRLPIDTQSHLYVGGNANAMLNQLYITGAERHLIDGSGRGGRYSMSELLRAGDYYVRWVIAGATLEDCSMGIESTQNNWQPLPIFYTPDMLKSLRPQRAKAEVDVSSE